MANLPTPNPIDAGYMNRGAAVDHLGSERIQCEACASEQKAEIYKMIMGRSGGFGAPVFVKPFLKHSSTKGKVGRKGTFALCCRCMSLWPQDQGARKSLTKEGFDPGGIIPEHMHYEMINRAAEELEKSQSEPEPAGLSEKSKVRQLAAEDVPASTPDPPPKQDQTRFCPHADCQGEVSATAKFCGFCGEPITESS